MAIVKLSGLLTSITGKLGGSVFQGSQGGLVLRNASTPKQTSTSIQDNRRRLLAQALASWLATTPVYKRNFGDSIKYNPVKQLNKKSYLLSPQALYVRIYYYRYFHTLNLAPQPIYLNDAVFQAFVTVSLVNGRLLVIMDALPPNGLHFLVGSISAPTNGKLAADFITKRSLIFVPNGTTTYDVTDQYLYIYTRLPLVGQRVVLTWAFCGKVDNSLTAFVTYSHAI